MAGPLARAFSRLSKKGSKESSKSASDDVEVVATAQHEVEQAKQMVDAIAQQNIKLHAEKLQLAESVKMLQQQLQLARTSVAHSEDGLRGVSATSSHSSASAAWQDASMLAAPALYHHTKPTTHDLWDAASVQSTPTNPSSLASSVPSSLASMLPSSSLASAPTNSTSGAAHACAGLQAGPMPAGAHASSGSSSRAALLGYGSHPTDSPHSMRSTSSHGDPASSRPLSGSSASRPPLAAPPPPHGVYFHSHIHITSPLAASGTTNAFTGTLPQQGLSPTSPMGGVSSPAPPRLLASLNGPPLDGAALHNALMSDATLTRSLGAQSLPSLASHSTPLSSAAASPLVGGRPAGSPAAGEPRNWVAAAAAGSATTVSSPAAGQAAAAASAVSSSMGLLGRAPPAEAHALLAMLSQVGAQGPVVAVAARQGWVHVIKALLDAGAPVNKVEEDTGLAPLHEAVLAGQADTTAFLLGNGAVPDLVALNGQTALQMAVGAGHCVLVPLLVSHGADMEIRSMSSASCLHEAAKDGRVEVVKALLTAGAKLENKDQQGRTPLHSAILSGRAAVVELLVGVGANIHAKSLRGMSMWDALRQALAEGKCSPDAANRIQALLWTSDGVKSRRGSRASEDTVSTRGSFRMPGADSP